MQIVSAIHGIFSACAGLLGLADASTLYVIVILAFLLVTIIGVVVSQARLRKARLHIEELEVQVTSLKALTQMNHGMVSEGGSSIVYPSASAALAEEETSDAAEEESAYFSASQEDVDAFYGTGAREAQESARSEAIADDASHVTEQIASKFMEREEAPLEDNGDLRPVGFKEIHDTHSFKMRSSEEQQLTVADEKETRYNDEEHQTASKTRKHSNLSGKIPSI